MSNDSGKLIIFVLISGALLFGFNYFFMPKQTPSQGAAAASAASAAPSKASVKSSTIPEPAISDRNQSMVPSSISSASEKTYKIENSLFEATFSNIGGTLKSFLLKKYSDSKDNKEALELIPSKSAYTYLSLSSPELNIGQAEWQAESVTNDSITFSRQIKPGVKISKIFTIKEGSYVIDTKLKFSNKTSAPVAFKDMQYTWGPNIHHLPGDLLKIKSGVGAGFNKIIYVNAGNIKTINMDLKTKDTKINVLDIVPNWIVIKDLYFTSSFMIGNKEDVKSVAIKQTNGGFAYIMLNLKDMLVNPGSEEVIEGSNYIGAAEYKQMKKYGMEKAVDLGGIRFLGIWMYYALDFGYKITKNWGLSILLITLLIRAALWWPSNSSYKNMKETQQKMSVIKPRLETLKKIYKGDEQKQNEEMMKLYQEYKINPFGGCLPMLLQIPIFIALYAALINMVELKGASFALWWTDLSKPDPFYVLPIFMGLTMLLQQKMSQTAPSMDAQSEMTTKMMMYGMPVVLTWMSFSWPAGLMLYWGVSNVFGIIQQMIVNKSK
jgi:YidC/Oxa1 family membrane protein insertase